MATEHDLKRKVHNWLRQQMRLTDGALWAVKVHGSVYQSAGTPDYLMSIRCPDGHAHFVAIELKRPDGKGKTSAAQQLQMEKIAKTHATTCVVESVEQLQIVCQQSLTVCVNGYKNFDSMTSRKTKPHGLLFRSGMHGKNKRQR